MDRDEHKDRKYLPRGQWQYTKKEKIVNWFHYYKWWLLGGAAALVVLISLLRTMLGVGVVKPDYSFGVITSFPLPKGTSEALETALENVAQDLNGDGKVHVEIVTFVTGDGADEETAMYFGSAAMVQLQANVMAADSHFFLMEDPALFQGQFQALADSEGKLSDEEDVSVEGRCLAWDECPGLQTLELPDEALSVLRNLSFGRRGYSDSSKVKYYDEFEALWALLTQPSGE